MRSLFHSRLQGFTLIEVLITVVMLSTGLVLVLQGLHGVLHVWDGAVQRIRAVMSAQEAFAGYELTVRNGTPADGTGLPFDVVAVAGRKGLYRVAYRPEIEGPDQADARLYSMLFYLPPDQEEQP